VGLFEEARFLVDPAAFDKYCFNGLKGRQLGRVSYFVEMVYHRAIKVSQEPIGTEPIFWNWFVGLFGVSNEVFMAALTAATPMEEIRSRQNPKSITAPTTAGVVILPRDRPALANSIPLRGLVSQK